MGSQVLTIKEVVDGGYCVGCGACSYVAKSAMILNKYGEYQPDLKSFECVTDSVLKRAEEVCPSLHPELNEDVLGKDLFPNAVEHNEFLGYIQSSYAAYAIEDSYRSNGTSGGMGTWVASELFKRGLIDGVVHVKPVHRAELSDPFFAYDISQSLEEIAEGSKTRYHVVEVSGVIEQIKNTEGRYLFIGIPCMSKAIRRLQAIDPVIKERIPYVISLVCGHLKSVNWSLSLAWGAGMEPSDVAAMQYRTKGERIPARSYVYQAIDFKNQIIQTDSATVVGGKFNVGAMMLPACDYCDDVVGETADLTIGDAWIPRFDVDDNGTNLLIVRNSIIHELLKMAYDKKRIFLENISNDEAVKSQDGGFRQRREGLSYRLRREINKNRKVPVKRISPDYFNLTQARKNIYDGRSEITLESRSVFLEALKANDYSLYTNRMGLKLKRLRIMELRSSFFRLAYKKIKRIIFSKIMR